MSTSYFTQGDNPHSIRWHWHDGATDAEKVRFVEDVLVNRADLLRADVEAWVRSAWGKPGRLVELVERLDPDRAIDVLAKLDGGQAKAAVVLALAGVAGGFLDHFRTTNSQTRLRELAKLRGRSNGRPT